MHRAGRYGLDVYAHNPYPLDPKRETPLHAPACKSLYDGHDGDARPARTTSSGLYFSPRADLADRVRLPKQST